MSRWNVPQIIDKTDSKHKVASDDTWVPGGGIETAWIYFWYGAKVYKGNVAMRKNYTM